MPNLELVSQLLDHLINKVRSSITLQYSGYVESTNYLFIDKFCYLPCVCMGKRSCLQPSRKIIYCYYNISISILRLRQRSNNIDSPSFKNIYWYNSSFPIIFLRSSSSLTFITRSDILLNIRSHALSYITLINLLSHCFHVLICRCWIIMKHIQYPRKFIMRYKSSFFHINVITLFSKLTCPFFICFICLF